MTIYGNMPNRSTAFTSFDGIPIRIMADRSGVYGGWEPEAIIVERHVPRSNRVYRQHMGAGLARITLRIEVASLNDYRRLFLAYTAQRKGRLTLLGDFVLLRGIPSTIHNDYEHYDNVVIDNMPRITGGAIGVERIPEFEITFAAAWDPLTLQVVP